MNTQAHEIEKAIAALEALKARTSAADIATIGRQKASYLNERDIALKANGIMSDLMVGLCESARALSDQPLTGVERRNLRCVDTLVEVFFDTDEWAGEPVVYSALAAAE